MLEGWYRWLECAQCQLAVTLPPTGTGHSSPSSKAKHFPAGCHLLSLQARRDPGAAGDPGAHLDQPKSGGAAQEMAMTQVKAMPIMAWLAEKRKLPMGLQMTM